MNRKFYTGLALLVITSVVLAACGAPATPTQTAAATSGPGQPTADPTADPFSPLNVSGDIITAGSSTVFPLSERIAERFSDEGFSGNVTIDSIGSGAGYTRFCDAADTDVANASRGIRASEIATCQTHGRDPIEFRVGTDALSVVVSRDNDFVTDVTTEELALIFGEAETWSDVRAEWPNEPIQRFIPGTDSGTFDYFVEHVYATDRTQILAASNTQLSEDDNVLVRGIQGSPYAIGFFGYAYYAENEDTLSILSVDGVEPNDATVEGGTYPLARPLFLYTTADILQEKPQVAAFIHFYLSFVNEEIVDVGYFPASDAVIQAGLDAFFAALGADLSADPFSPLSVSGEIITAGSSTVFPLSERIAERFGDEGFSGNVTIDSIGSGAGYTRFCEAADTDIANASRGIRDSEIATCEAHGRTPVEFRVGTDALSVVVSRANDFVTDVTTEELALIFGEAETWSDVRPEWPNEPIQRFIPGTDSGTFDYFVEHVYATDRTQILAASNTQLSEDDNVLVQGVQGSQYAIGFFGYAYYAENQDTLRILSVDGVEPNDETVEGGTYPLARPLFLYTTADILQQKPQVAAFLHFYLTVVNEEIVDVGYFPASDAVIQQSLVAFFTALGQ